MYAATYQLEFREVLTLYLHTARRLREDEAARIDAQADDLEMRTATAFGLSQERVRALADAVRGMRDRAARLREPEQAQVPVADPEGQQAFLAGSRLPGV